MKATLEFDLPIDQTDFNWATKGWRYFSILTEIEEYFRSELKYNDNLTKEEVATLEKVQADILALIGDATEEE